MISKNLRHCWVIALIAAGLGVCEMGCSSDGECVPATCKDAGKDCGTIPDGCGETLECGTCTAPETCGGGGEENVCGCTTLSCLNEGNNRRTIPRRLRRDARVRHLHCP